VAEADDDEPPLLDEDGLVHRPPGVRCGSRYDIAASPAAHPTIRARQDLGGSNLEWVARQTGALGFAQETL
jgi:hypothetical protein